MYLLTRVFSFLLLFSFSFSFVQARPAEGFWDDYQAVLQSGSLRNPELKEGKILVVGAGIGGLSAAAALQKVGFHRVSVVERDAGPEVRPQGYSVTMQQAMRVLEELGLGETIKALPTRNEIQVCVDGAGEILYQNPGNSERRWSIPLPRQQLRQLLLEILDEGTVQWGKKVVGVHHQEVGVLVDYADGSHEYVDAVIAADGVWSPIRQGIDGNTLNDFSDAFSGKQIMMINGMSSSLVPCPFLESLEREDLHNVELQVFDGKAKLFVKPFDAELSMWELTFPCESGLKFSSLEEALELALKETELWQSSLRNFLAATDPKGMRAGYLYDRDPVHELPEHGAVCLVGDALHAMTPFKGQGANNAIMDAAELVTALREAESFSQAFRDFEEGALQRSRYYVMSSRKATELYHTEQVFSYFESKTDK